MILVMGVTPNCWPKTPFSFYLLLLCCNSKEKTQTIQTTAEVPKGVKFWMELKLDSRVQYVTQRRRVRDVKEEEKNPTFPSTATTGQTNFKVEPSCSLPRCPHCPTHPVTLQITTPGLWGRFLCTSAPEQDHFHKEISAPSESTRLPLNCLRLGPQPGPNSLSLSFCLLATVYPSLLRKSVVRYLSPDRGWAPFYWWDETETVKEWKRRR